MRILKEKYRRLYLVLTALIVVGGFIFWVSDLTSDPPMYYGGLGQSLGTDPAQYVFHARNAVMTGDWDPYDYPRWTVYQHSLTSLAAYVVFSATEVSMARAGLVGVMLSFGGLIMILIGLWRMARPWVMTAVALSWVANVSLITYGRLPYLENGLLFWAGAMFMVFSLRGRHTWGAALGGLLVALAGFTGKIFGLLLLGPLLLAYLGDEPERRWRQILTALGGFVAGSVLLVVALYGSDVTAAFGYAGEQAYGLRGFPEGLSSPWAFVEHLIGYGFSNRVWYLDPDLFAFLIIGLALVVLTHPEKTDWRSIPPNLRLVLGWVVVCYLAMMPLNYSPIRYALILFPALVLLAWLAIDHLLGHKKRSVLYVPAPFRLVLLGLLAWFASYQLVRNIFWFNTPAPDALLWLGLIPGIAITWLIKWTMSKYKINVSRRNLGILVMLLILFVGVTNAFRVRRYHIRDHNYNFAEASYDLEHLLNPGAVVSGPYGPVLTTDTELGSFIHLFAAVSQVDSALFDEHPITHIAVDVSNLVEARKQYPELDSARHVVSYWLRDVEVGVYRVSDLFDNENAHRYQPSHFELSQDWFLRGQADSARAELGRHLADVPLTKSAAVLLADLQLKAGQLSAAMQTLTAAAEECPTDFYLQLQCGRLYLLAGLSKQDGYLTEKSKQYFERGVAANRFKGDMAMQLADQVYRLVQRGQ